MMITIPVIVSYFLGTLVTLASLVKTVNSKVSWVVVQGGHFWHLKSRVFTGLAMEAQKRETGGIESEGDIRGGGSEGFWAGSWDSGILCFHLNSCVYHFLVKCHLLSKLYRIRCRCRGITSIA